ncbi:hypothetical protein LJK88_11265 [Paenibacillus sp. P26]|nr:hypothetical protein LJK88_11265 [Paenibacillus sp. P26]UUZ89625.1 hypothetical protein LJK87_26425 [Paenibacillus sp. P25]
MFNLPVTVQSGRFTGPGLNVAYPVIADMPDRAVQNRINRMIVTEVNLLIRRQGSPIIRTRK